MILSMKRILTALIFSLPFFVNAQHFDAGVMVGASNYLGDLAPSSFFGSLGDTNFSAGAFGRYNINDWVAVRGQFMYGKISAEDAKSNDGTGEFRENRNLSFRSNIYEFGLIGEVNILGYQPYAMSRTFSPYVFGGVAVFKFNPQAYYEGTWYDLQPLGTEGQGMPDGPEKYSLTKLSIPFGGGIKYAINDKWNLGLEIGLRKVFTDYLDDVSTTYADPTALAANNGELALELAWRGDELDSAAEYPNVGSGRGDSTNDDWYVISGITVSYNFFDNGLAGSRGRNRRRSGCPTF